MSNETTSEMPVAQPRLVLPCECRQWARIYDGVEDKGTDHHPRCPHVDDSLIDVWRVTYDFASYVVDYDVEKFGEGIEEDATVTKERMHRELFDRMPEFAGF